ncbi:MAG: site-specific tyrosine recombinase XerD [Actinobacteria bacterium]|nr:site-specific tyrosine recombinase XerD [Actinomycetota bacterium]
MSRLSGQIEDYLRHLTIERGMAKNTLLAYRRDLNIYLEFLARQEISSASEVTEANVKEFAQFLVTGKGLVATSVARVLAAVRGFHKFLLMENLVPDDAAGKVKPPKLPKRLPKAISIAEVELLLKAAGPDPEDGVATTGDLIRIRDRAILELLYATGARVSELVSMDVDDLVDPEIVRLFGKGSKERLVPVGRFAQAALASYQVRVRPDLAKLSKGTPALFLNQRGTRLSRQSVWQIISDAAKRAKLEREVSPHTFRHSFATHLLEGGADVRVVQELLGHASVSTTQIYTLVTVDALREIYATAHPRAQR